MQERIISTGGTVRASSGPDLSEGDTGVRPIGWDGLAVRRRGVIAWSGRGGNAGATSRGSAITNDRQSRQPLVQDNRV